MNASTLAWRFFFSLVFGVVLLGVGSPCNANEGLRDDGSGDLSLVYKWLSAQQDSSTGLVPSQQNSTASTYDNALAVMAFVLNGEMEKARRILDFYKNRCNSKEFYVGNQARGFFQFRDSINGEPYCKVDRWMGDNAWLALAIHYYKKATGDAKYDVMAQRIVALLMKLRQPVGYVAQGWKRHGCNENETLNSEPHAEGNLDAYAVLRLYGKKKAASDVKDWLDHSDLDWKYRYSDGYGVFPPYTEDNRPRYKPLDHHSWRVLSLGRDYGFCLLDMKPYVRTIRYRGAKVNGYVPFIPWVKWEGPDKDGIYTKIEISPNIWSEGTGEMAVAFFRAGYKSVGDSTLTQLRKLLFEPADFPGTLTIAYFALEELKKHEWVDPTKGHVAGVCWYIFAEKKFDPFRGETIKQSPPQNPVCRIEAENYHAKSSTGFRDKDGKGHIYDGWSIHLAGDNPTPALGDESGWALYQFNLLNPIAKADVSVRYADDVGGDICKVLIDDKVVGSFVTVDTKDAEHESGWDVQQWSNPPMRVNGALSKGGHTLKLIGIDKGTYGFTVDSIRIEKK